jgi:hypothetical protein
MWSVRMSCLVEGERERERGGEREEGRERGRGGRREEEKKREGRGGGRAEGEGDL